MDSNGAMAVGHHWRRRDYGSNLATDDGEPLDRPYRSIDTTIQNAMMACALRLIGLQTQQSIQSTPPLRLPKIYPPSFCLLHIRRRATDTAGDQVLGAAIPAETADGASAYPADVTTGNTNNPVGLDRTTPMGPNNDTLIVNSDTAASPTLEKTTASTVDTGPNADTHIADSDTAASPTLKRKRKYSPAHAARGISRRAVVCSSSSSWHPAFGVMLLTRSWALGKGPIRLV